MIIVIILALLVFGSFAVSKAYDGFCDWNAGWSVTAVLTFLAAAILCMTPLISFSAEKRSLSTLENEYRSIEQDCEAFVCDEMDDAEASDFIATVVAWNIKVEEALELEEKWYSDLVSNPYAYFESFNLETLEEDFCTVRKTLQDYKDFTVFVDGEETDREALEKLGSYVNRYYDVYCVDEEQQAILLESTKE